MLEAIVFDFDGVLVDTEPLHYRAFAETMSPLGVTFDYERYREKYIGYDDRDGFRSICAEHGIALDDRMLVGLIAQKAERFERIAGSGVATMPGASELLDAAAAAMPIALCSGASRRDIELVLPNLGRFRVVVTADDVKRSKPDPEGYALAARRLGIRSERCLAIEDTPAGVASAKSAGLWALAVTTSFPAAMLAEADRVAESLAGVSVANLREWFSTAVNR